MNADYLKAKFKNRKKLGPALYDAAGRRSVSSGEVPHEHSDATEHSDGPHLSRG